MNNTLVVLDQVQKQLATITTVAEAKDARDRVEALHRYAKHSRQKLQTRNKVALLQFRLERRAGELLHAIPKVQGQRDGANGLVEHIKRSGLTTFTAYRWMTLAEMPEAELLRAGAQCDAEGDELTSTLVYGWLVKHATGQTPAKTLPPARDLLGSSELLVTLRVLEPGMLDGLSPEMQNVVVTELRGVYDDYCEDERRGKIATEDGWNPPIVINVTRLRTLTREMLSVGGTLTPGAVRTRLRGFLDEVVSHWEQRLKDPGWAIKKPTSGGYGTGRTRADAEYDRRFTSRFPPYEQAAHRLIDAVEVLVRPYGLLNEPPQLDRDAVLTVAGTVRAALDVMERHVSTSS